MHSIWFFVFALVLFCPVVRGPMIIEPFWDEDSTEEHHSDEEHDDFSSEEWDEPREIARRGGGGKNASKTRGLQNSLPVIKFDLPLECPEGWVQLGFSEHCYKLPDHPAVLDTFDGHQRRCQQLEPTSHILVINDWAEQAAATAAAVQITSNLPNLLSTFLWLGGRTTSDNNIALLDGSTSTANVVLIASDAGKPSANDSCLTASPTSLASWSWKSCSDKTGAAICEMPRRPVCGKTGGIFPITPVSFTRCNTVSSFRNLNAVPYTDQLLGETVLGDQLTGSGIQPGYKWNTNASDVCAQSVTSKPIGNVQQPRCKPVCPIGWLSWSRSPNEQCYFLNSALPTDTFWNMQQKCKRLNGASYVSMINGFMELSMAMVIAQEQSTMWLHSNPNAHLWLGAYTTGSGWKFLDGSDGGVLVTMANLTSQQFKNGTCLAVDVQTMGNWRLLPCSNPNGIALCEMNKDSTCPKGEGGFFTNKPIGLTPAKLQELFPIMASMPFLGQVLGTEVKEDYFDPWQAFKNNLTNQKLGDIVSTVVCVKKIQSKVDWIVLGGSVPDMDRVIVPGRWMQHQCLTGVVEAFKIQPSTYLAVWSRCVNRGYEVAMTLRGFKSERVPFQVGDAFAEHFSLDKSTGSYVKKPFSRIAKCGAWKRE